MVAALMASFARYTRVAAFQEQLGFRYNFAREFGQARNVLVNPPRIRKLRLDLTVVGDPVLVGSRVVPERIADEGHVPAKLRPVDPDALPRELETLLEVTRSRVGPGQIPVQPVGPGSHPGCLL